MTPEVSGFIPGSLEDTDKHIKHFPEKGVLEEDVKNPLQGGGGSVCV